MFVPTKTLQTARLLQEDALNGADYHDRAAEACRHVVNACRVAAKEPSEDLKLNARGAAQHAQTLCGDAGGPRADIFKAEDLIDAGKYEKAAALAERQAAYHVGRAANWRRQVLNK